MSLNPGWDRWGVARWLMTLTGCGWLVSGAGAAQVLTATFDDLPEGTLGMTLVNGGLTFSELKSRIPGSPTFSPFTIEDASAIQLPFSQPNILTFGGYSEGPGFVLTRFGSAWIDFEGLGIAASVDVFGIGLSEETVARHNTLTLEAWNGNNLVASSSTFFLPFTFQHQLLSVGNAPFDRLRLIATGPVASGTVQSAVDNFSVTLVPEPTPWALAGLGLAVWMSYRRIFRRTSAGTDQ